MNEIRAESHRSNENYQPSVFKRAVKSSTRLLAIPFKAIGKALSSKDNTPLPGRVSTDGYNDEESTRSVEAFHRTKGRPRSNHITASTSVFSQRRKEKGQIRSSRSSVSDPSKSSEASSSQVRMSSESSGETKSDRDARRKLKQRLGLIRKMNETLSQMTSIGKNERIEYESRLKLWKRIAIKSAYLNPEVQRLESILKSLPDAEVVFIANKHKQRLDLLVIGFKPTTEYSYDIAKRYFDEIGKINDWYSKQKRPADKKAIRIKLAPRLDELLRSLKKATGNTYDKILTSSIVTDQKKENILEKKAEDSRADTPTSSSSLEENIAESSSSKIHESTSSSEPTGETAMKFMRRVKNSFSMNDLQKLWPHIDKALQTGNIPRAAREPMNARIREYKLSSRRSQ